MTTWRGRVARSDAAIASTFSAWAARNRAATSGCSRISSWRVIAGRAGHGDREAAREADLARERARERVEWVGQDRVRRDRRDAGRVDQRVPRRPHRDRDGRCPGLGDRPDERRLGRLPVRLDGPDDDGIERPGACAQAGDLGVARGDRHDDIVDRGETRAQRPPETGRDRRRRVGRCQVGRFGHDREDPGAGREGDRRRLGAAGRAVEPGQRPLRELARDGPVVGRADDVEVGRRTRGREPGSKVGQARARGLQFVRFEQAAGRCRAERLLDPALGWPVRRAQEQVDPGADRRDDLDRLGGALGQRVHVERVADRQRRRSRAGRAACRP